MPPVPVLIDAIYDPARNLTTIRGVLPAEGRKNGWYTVRLFKRTPAVSLPIGQPYEDRLTATGDVAFTLPVVGDLRGSTIVGQSGFLTFSDSFPDDTSELSAPLVVQ
jgi:hypothetical protein